MLEDAEKSSILEESEQLQSRQQQGVPPLLPSVTGLGLPLVAPFSRVSMSKIAPEPNEPPFRVRVSDPLVYVDGSALVTKTCQNVTKKKKKKHFSTII